MKLPHPLLTACAAALLASTAHGAASTGTPFYGDAPDKTHPWAIHDRNRPQPPRVEPGTFSTTEQALIQRIWLRVAEDYAAFDVDITTEANGLGATTRYFERLPHCASTGGH